MRCRRSLAGTFKQDPAEIEKTISRWRKLHPDATFAIAIEATKGALINALIEYDDLEIYPINPAALASYRKAFAHGGGKNDPTDAMLIAQYLKHYQDQLRPLRHDSPLTRELADLSRNRRRLVDQRADLANELTAVIKQYYPAVLQLGAAKAYANFVLRLVINYPTLADAQKAGKTRLRKFFYGLGLKANTEQRIETLIDAKPLCRDEVVLRSSARRAVALCELLQTLSRQIRRHETELKQLLPQHADLAVVAGLPNAAAFTQARMIGVLGDDRSRYPTVECLQAATGIAPVTIQSGKMKLVRCRWASPKFSKQTFHEYAGQSIGASRWATAFYNLQLSRNKSPQAAKRSLAFKWQRIIHACWLSGEAYDEDRYIERLKATGSPLYDLILLADQDGGEPVTKTAKG